MEHLLHKKIGNVLKKVDYGACELVLDPACGGDQNIPLFVEKSKSNQTQYCNVDALILNNGHARGIIEIEESNIKPTQICGKFLTSALADFYQHERHDDKPIPICAAYFLQIVDTSELIADKTSKLAQFENIEHSIKSSLPLKDRNSRIISYKLITTKGVNDKMKLNEIKKWIKRITSENKSWYSLSRP